MAYKVIFHGNQDIPHLLHVDLAQNSSVFFWAESLSGSNNIVKLENHILFWIFLAVFLFIDGRHVWQNADLIYQIKAMILQFKMMCLTVLE